MSWSFPSWEVDIWAEASIVTTAVQAFTATSIKVEVDLEAFIHLEFITFMAETNLDLKSYSATNLPLVALAAYSEAANSYMG